MKASQAESDKALLEDAAPDQPVTESEASSDAKGEIDLDIEDFDLSEDYIMMPAENDKVAKKMAARRKIEMYWEKKRLKEQLGEFDDFDLDFDF
ncbi:PA3496 family putative envelope integrity protein [Methylobacter sp.]|uniref:PA3496 family putative envelope integrity protein n=1 Tax=Methylobacter sp. TaxID=2051955 RepID=UPI003DA58821